MLGICNTYWKDIIFRFTRLFTMRMSVISSASSTKATPKPPGQIISALTMVLQLGEIFVSFARTCWTVQVSLHWMSLVFLIEHWPVALFATQFCYLMLGLWQTLIVSFEVPLVPTKVSFWSVVMCILARIIVEEDFKNDCSIWTMLCVLSFNWMSAAL